MFWVVGDILYKPASMCVPSQCVVQPAVLDAGAMTAYTELNYQKNKNTEYLSPSPITNLNFVTLPANAAFWHLFPVNPTN